MNNVRCLCYLLSYGIRIGKIPQYPWLVIKTTGAKPALGPNCIWYHTNRTQIGLSPCKQDRRAPSIETAKTEVPCHSAVCHGDVTM